ncbi:MAG: phosphoribosylglycinamide formyltransferase [Bacteroidetes bacterium]|nr:phosphoribosylglycinamide formyltransferase [Bacteroidota bacterium]MBL7104666.1 phosphoribosylglycinamide formyltransferase [Bacteroidales bacterium]
MNNIAIFASGSGSNAQRIIEYFNKNRSISVTRIFCNKKDAYVLSRAEKLGIPTFVFGRNEFYNSNEVLDKLKDDEIDLIVLAGFLWLVPANILSEFSNRIINIHPALLPKYGGKSMYGMRVHEAVISAGEKESGISIHYVNEKYDEGEIIFQKKCIVEKDETPESLSAKIHQLEYEHFPKTIEKLIIKVSLSS